MEAITLAEAYLPLAKKVAGRIWEKTRRVHDLDDLKAQAALILVKAVDSHDAARGSLANHLYFRLERDLISYIRSSGPLSLDHHKRILSGELPSVNHISLDADIQLVAPTEGAIDAIFADCQIDRLLPAARLNRRERLVIKRLRRGHTIDRIAKGLKVSRSRISQNLSDAVTKLRAAEQVRISCLKCGKRLEESQTKFCGVRCWNAYRDATVCSEPGCERPAFKVPKKTENRSAGSKCKFHYRIAHANNTRRYRAKHKMSPAELFRRRSEGSKLIWANRRAKSQNNLKESAQ